MTQCCNLHATVSYIKCHNAGNFAYLSKVPHNIYRIFIMFIFRCYYEGRGITFFTTQLKLTLHTFWRKLQLYTFLKNVALHAYRKFCSLVKISGL